MFIGEKLFEKSFSPNPLFKNFYTKWIDKVWVQIWNTKAFCTSIKIHIRTLCTHFVTFHSLKFFGRGSGKPFFKKGFPEKSYFIGEF